MVLVQQGKLSLDESRERFLPVAPARWRSITVRELLNHTSGLPQDAPGENPFESRPPLDEDLAKWDVALAREVPLSSASKSAMWTATPKPTGAPFGYGFGKSLRAGVSVWSTTAEVAPASSPISHGFQTNTSPLW